VAALRRLCHKRRQVDADADLALAAEREVNDELTSLQADGEAGAERHGVAGDAVGLLQCLLDAVRCCESRILVTRFSYGCRSL